MKREPSPSFSSSALAPDRGSATEVGKRARGGARTAPSGAGIEGHLEGRWDGSRNVWDASWNVWDASWHIWNASWNVWDASWDAFGDVSATGRLPSLNTEALPLALSLEVANDLEVPTIVAALVAFLAPP